MSFPIKDGGSFHSYMAVYQRVNPLNSIQIPHKIVIFHSCVAVYQRGIITVKIQSLQYIYIYKDTIITYKDTIIIYKDTIITYIKIQSLYIVIHCCYYYHYTMSPVLHPSEENAPRHTLHLVGMVIKAVNTSTTQSLEGSSKSDHCFHNAISCRLLYVYECIR